jgi:hypothetical protein
MRRWFLFALLAWLVLGVLATVPADAHHGRGSHATVTPTSVPTATAHDPLPTGTPEPMPTMPPMMGDHACGLDPAAWHPPVVDGCAAGHEHGDEPPDWLQQSQWPLSYVGAFNTSAMENVMKHAAMKGFLAVLDGQEVYARVHAASNVLDRSARYHSFEYWQRDAAGGISHWTGWYDVGSPETARIPRVVATDLRPVILVVDQASWDAGFRCEQWYTDGPGWRPALGWTICDSTTLYYPGENAEQGMGNWQLTGSLGLLRRLEWSWRQQDSPSLPRDQVVYLTQFGQWAEGGPLDPLCSSTTTKFGVMYQNVCLEQYIASTAGDVVFPGNDVQRQFAGPAEVPN